MRQFRTTTPIPKILCQYESEHDLASTKESNTRIVITTPNLHLK
jgi:hypothetical protein